MAKKKNDDEITVEPDDEDPADAEDDTDDEKEKEKVKEIEPVTLPKEDDNVEGWKKKFYDEVRQRSEMDAEYKAKYIRMQDELRESQMKSFRSEEMGGSGDQYGRPPVSSQSITTENAPPFKLVKMVEVMAANGQKILVPREISGATFERMPRVEDLQEGLIMKWGGGEYKIRNRNDVIVGSVNVPVVGDTGSPNPGAMMGQSGMTLGQFMQSPIDRALTLFERAKKDNDPTLAKMAADAIQAELNRGTAAPSDQNTLQTALQTMVTMFGLMQQAKATFDATIGGGGPSAVPEAVQLKKMELELAREKSKGLTDLGTGVASQLKDVIPQLAQYFKKPDMTPEAVNAAASRLAANAPQRPPPPQRPISTPSLLGTTSAPRPSPTAPPQQSVVPPGSIVVCGCGQRFEVPAFVAHAQAGCPGAQGAAQTPTAQSSSQTAIPKGESTMQLPPDLKTYLGLMKTLSTYIEAYKGGDQDAAPESVAGAVWLGTAMNKEQRDKLVEVVDMGYDAIVANPELTKVVEGLKTFPNFTKEQTAAFIAAAIASKILTPEEVGAANDLTDLAPAVDEFRNHIAIQRDSRGREWFCRLLNALALKAKRPAPHAEFLPGGRAVERNGRDNL